MALVRAVPLRNFLSTAAPLSTGAAAGSSAYSTVGPNAGERLFAGLHLTQAGTSVGTTARLLAMTIQSASSSGFAAVTTEIIFNLSTAQGSTWQTLAPGAALSTDRPWRRANWVLATGPGSTAGNWNGLAWIGFRSN